MNGKKHKPPSRISYEKNNPVFSVRMPKEWHDTLNKQLEDAGQSRKDFLAQALGIKTESYKSIKKKAYDEGYDRGHKDGHDDGYDEGKNKRVIDLSCYSCRILIENIPLSEVQDKLIYLSKENNICMCKECIDFYTKIKN